MNRARALLLGVLVAGAALAAPAAADALAVCRADPDLCPAPSRLSDERTLTRLATPVALGAVRSRPDRRAGRVSTLRFYTEERLPELYLARSQAIGTDGRVWVHVRLPGRPNGRSGWVAREHLGAWRTVRTYLRVNRSLLRATLYKDGRKVWRSPVGVGTRATPTPAGRYWVRTRLRNLAGGNPAYGPVAFGTAAYSVLSDWPGGGVIGIHGTDRPALLPGRVSHGCVRVPNAAVRRLARLMTVGTPVRIVGR